MYRFGFIYAAALPKRQAIVGCSVEKMMQDVVHQQQYVDPCLVNRLSPY